MKVKSSLLVLVILCSCVRASPGRFDNAEETPREVVMKWTKLYGKDTRAALLTTERFRNGMHWREWADEIQHRLQEIRYEHLGGEILEEIITGEVATLILQARIVAVDGISLQKEIYTLKRKGGWLIDSLTVKEEVIPRRKVPGI